MSRQARLVLVLVVMAVIAVVALAIVARQYSGVSEPTRSVADLPPHLSNSTLPVLGPDRAPAPASSSTGATESVPRTVPRPTPSAGDAAAIESVAEVAVDPVVATQWPGFVAGRAAVKQWIEDNPTVARDIVDEATGFELGRERISMHTMKVMQIRVTRGRAAIDAGLDEDSYRAVREQYRLWKDGGDADPAWERWYGGDPERASTIDLGKYEVLDF